MDKRQLVQALALAPLVLGFAGARAHGTPFTLVSDYGPGLDAERTLRDRFLFNGGQTCIDANTRDIVQSVYIRKVERVPALGNALYNVEFQEHKDVRNPPRSR